MTTHLMFDGALQLYRRGDGKVWQSAARVGGERFRQSTHETELSRAKDVAEEWYLDLRGRLRNGQIVKKEKTFGEAAEDYMRHFRVLAAGLRSPAYIEGMELRLKVHVGPFFSKTPLSEVNRGLVMSYRVKRAEDTIAKTLQQSLLRIDRDEKNGLAAVSSDEEIRQVVAACAERRRTAQGKSPARSTIDHEMVLIRHLTVPMLM